MSNGNVPNVLDATGEEENQQQGSGRFDAVDLVGNVAVHALPSPAAKPAPDPSALAAVAGDPATVADAAAASDGVISTLSDIAGGIGDVVSGVFDVA